MKKIIIVLSLLVSANALADVQTFYCNAAKDISNPVERTVGNLSVTNPEAALGALESSSQLVGEQAEQYFRIEGFEIASVQLEQEWITVTAKGPNSHLSISVKAEQLNVEGSSSGLVYENVGMQLFGGQSFCSSIIAQEPAL